MRIFKTSDNKQAILATQLGVGGEGTVYEVQGNQDVVAKILKNTSPQKERRLQALVALGSPSLSRVSAIPQELLYDKNGYLAGFLMSRVQGGEPIHHFYSPSWRKNNYPNASWKTLLQVSRNVAQAFFCLHSSSIIVGDVNPNSVFINAAGHAKLIDADSYQVTHGSPSVTYTCDVGVANFTPPELQREKTFRGLIRNENHDLFGLSLLIFHLLFMGRHPFSGVTKTGDSRSLEENISNLCCAYTSLSESTLSPPSFSVKPELVCSRNVVDAFERSFGPAGLAGRPTARQWIQLLDAQISNLRCCELNVRHYFDNSISNCPWCQIDSRGFSFFEATQSKFYQQPNPRRSPESSRAIWVKIKELSDIPDLERLLAVTPKQVLTPDISDEIRNALSRRKITRFGAFACAVMGFASLAASPAAFAIFALICIALLNSQPRSIQEEARKIRKSIESLDHELKALFVKLKHTDGSESSRDRHLRSEAQQAINAIIDLPRIRDSKVSDLRIRSVNLQKDRYLSSFLISDANISGIGSSRKSILQSFGIDSAKDIEYQRIIRIDGFGPVLASNLMDWRSALLANFSIPPGASEIQASDIESIDKVISSSHERLHKQLEGCLVEMMKLRSFRSGAEFSSMLERYRQGVRLKAQLEANLRAIL
jgi:DNA-binding helix-hairpin-helix protein with protein kinase domain